VKRLILAAMIGIAFSAGLALSPARAAEAVAVFAGGCFWCMEPPYDKTEGVISTTSGYTGGNVPNPSYKEVSAGTTGHIEAVKIVYDPEKVSYEKLLHIFWRNIDPVRENAQFCDEGAQYRSAIFPQEEAQREAAERSKADLEATGRFTRPIATEILDAAPFYAAEAYHQDYYKKNPNRYAYYRWSCGRDARLKQVWGDEAGGL
jgi:peptide-methionine (S)-S-oxide reductase